jgi:hypothetical protein
MTPVAPAAMMRALVRFTAVQGVLVVLGCVLLQQFVFTDASSASAVRASAWLAFTVQILTFAIARLVSRENVMAGWGMGIILRFATVAFWALLGIKAMGLPMTPALLSLAMFFFVSTLVEPLFLNT